MHLLIGEHIEEVHVEFNILHVGGDGEEFREEFQLQAFCGRSRFGGKHASWVFEQGVHEPRWREQRLHLCALLQSLHLWGVVDKPFHIGLVGGYIEGERRMELVETIGEGKHALAATIGSTRTSPYPCVSGSEDSGEVLNHALCDALMLAYA